MPSLIKTPSRLHRLPCRSPPPAWKLPTPWPASGRKSTRLHLPIVPIVVESRGRVLDRVDTASWKCPLQYSNFNLASLKIEAGDGSVPTYEIRPSIHKFGPKSDHFFDEKPEQNRTKNGLKSDLFHKNKIMVNQCSHLWNPTPYLQYQT